MDQKSLTMLEYPQVIEKLASYASFDLSEKMALDLHPYQDPDVIRGKLELVREARHLLSVNDDIHLGACFDAEPLLTVVEKSGTLEGTEIYALSYMMSVGRDLGRSLKFHADEYPKLARIGEGLTPPHGLIEKINHTVTDHGEVLDSASDKLANIRREIRRSHSRLLEKLDKILRDPRYQPMLQEAIITQRGGRYVIPLKAEYKGQLKALIHDQSASGATLFVEPLATVDLNNEYQELQLAERDEVRRILHELCVEIGENAGQIRMMVRALTQIDFTLMCARYADDLKAYEPVIAPKRHKTGNPVIKLYEARHPLLPADQAVPLDVVLDENQFIVIITGPNTGGKTVTLKTIGLMILMAQSGLHIPAQSGSEISLFQDVFADIGDEQSIEQSLSTFSGHMTNQIRILNRANGKTLVLLDELGSGTDPQEGAALAYAIMQYIANHRIPCFAATHFSELKLFGHSVPGAVNASMEFDLKTLRPTYRLSIGLPGRSNALLIAKKLGLSQEILELAQQNITPTDTDTDSLLNEIQRQYDAAKKARSHADRMRSLAENSEREYRRRLEEIEDERQKILQDAREAAEDEMESLREELKRIKRQMSTTRSTEILQLDADLKAAEKEIKQKSNAAKKLHLPDEPDHAPLKVGEKVIVRTLGTDSLAVITALDKNEAEIQLGSLRMRVPLRDLSRKNGEPVEAEPPAPASGKTIREEVFHASPGVELDCRGLDTMEMADKLEKYLDDAVLAGLPYVRIIHGKGTGRLRQAARKMLHENPHVKYIEVGGDSEGGEGVTVAHLRG